MGIAEVIPGVSGGTIAFISGIYEDLLHSIKAFDLDLIKLLFKGRFSEILTKINAPFLVNLVIGMTIGIVLGIFTITWLLKHYPEPLWGFFFGLVMSSAILISRHASGWNFSKIASLLMGITVAVFISVVTPTEGSEHPFYIFICGMIAISAFILPGVSGSFMLLLLGMYTLIIPSLKNIMVHFDTHSIYIIVIFSLGCVVGIVWFSRVLSWLFDHYNNRTFDLLTGFLIGSLYKIWPWRNITSVLDKETGVVSQISTLESYSALDSDRIKILSESVVLPSDYWMSSPKILITILCVFLGFGLVLLIELNNKNKSLSQPT